MRKGELREGELKVEKLKSQLDGLSAKISLAWGNRQLGKLKWFRLH